MRNNGYLSEESYNNDMRDYQTKATNAQNAIAQREQQIAEQAAAQQKQAPRLARELPQRLRHIKRL